MVGLSPVFKVVFTEPLPVQPLPSVTVTAKVPAVFTVMVCAVEPIDQL